MWRSFTGTIKNCPPNIWEIAVANEVLFPPLLLLIIGLLLAYYYKFRGAKKHAVKIGLAVPSPPTPTHASTTPGANLQPYRPHPNREDEPRFPAHGPRQNFLGRPRRAMHGSESVPILVLIIAYYCLLLLIIAYYCLLLKRRFFPRSPRSRNGQTKKSIPRRLALFCSKIRPEG